jgi:hypothetical protein
MPKRLSEQYEVGEEVEILFEQLGRNAWIRGAVVGVHAPGLWVRLASGGMWFVTNTRRIRPAAAPSADEE